MSLHLEFVFLIILKAVYLLYKKLQKYYVYIPDEKLYESDIYYPSAQEVRDCKFTNEVWIKKEIKIKCIGIIQSQNYDWSKRHNTGYGRIIYFHYLQMDKIKRP